MTAGHRFSASFQCCPFVILAIGSGSHLAPKPITSSECPPLWAT